MVPDLPLFFVSLPLAHSLGRRTLPLGRGTLPWAMLAGLTLPWRLGCARAGAPPGGQMPLPPGRRHVLEATFPTPGNFQGRSARGRTGTDFRGVPFQVAVEPRLGGRYHPVGKVSGHHVQQTASRSRHFLGRGSRLSAVSGSVAHSLGRQTRGDGRAPPSEECRSRLPSSPGVGEGTDPWGRCLAITFSKQLVDRGIFWAGGAVRVARAHTP